jgi:predicted secreted protein
MMNLNKVKKIFFIITATCLFSCNIQKKQHSRLEVKKDKTFEISLKANPTTGYSWKWIKNKSQNLLDSIGSNYQQDKAPSEMVGVGGKEIWKFKGKQVGIDILTFKYCRRWNANSTVETKKIVVKIK